MAKKNKIKIKKALLKRFKITAGGKVLSTPSFNRHLKLKKSKSRLRRLSVPREITGKMAIKLKKALALA